ncbi:signal peptidase I [Saccharospirillum sp. MSK14-1]|uniref:signal peptidase I n=1 Tax=Saccharospirillum sp. MSK14-1 TaxID=1897632 RepID=UPI0026D9277D
MNVIVIFWACLALTLGLAVLTLVRHRARLKAVVERTDWTEDELKVLFEPGKDEKALGYLLLLLLLWLVVQTIQASFDFALVLTASVATTGAVWLADMYWLRPLRRRVLENAAASIDGFDPKHPPMVAEPGVIDNSRAFLPVLLAVFLLRSFMFEPFRIPSGSMKPTLEIGDFILVNRFTYGLRMPISNDIVIPVNDPERGDIVVFNPPHKPSISYIKRVIGVPGDRIQYDYGRRILTLNGEPVELTFDRRVTDDEGRYIRYTEQLDGKNHAVYLNQAGPSRQPYEWLPSEGVVVPEGHYFVMGDNRDSSLDARYWEGLRRGMQGDFSNSGDNAWGFVDEDEILGQAVGIWMHWRSFFDGPSFSRFGGIE